MPFFLHLLIGIAALLRVFQLEEEQLAIAVEETGEQG